MANSVNYCDECEIVLLPGAVKCKKCGWINTKPNEQRVQAVSEASDRKGNDLLSDYMEDSLKDVKAFKKEHGPGWQHELMKKVVRDQKTVTALATKKSIKKREKLKPKFSDEYKETQSVFDSMPAPRDHKGMEEYKEKLAKVQGSMINTPAERQ